MCISYKLDGGGLNCPRKSGFNASKGTQRVNLYVMKNRPTDKLNVNMSPSS